MTQTTTEQRQEWKRLRTEAETEYPWKSERGTQNGKGWVIPQANPYHDGEFCYHTKPIAKFIESAYVAVPALLSDLDAAEAERERLRAALQRIERWFGEFPETGRFWDEPKNTQPMSYSACYGSNGERDYMREVARTALENKP